MKGRRLPIRGIAVAREEFLEIDDRCVRNLGDEAGMKITVHVWLVERPLRNKRHSLLDSYSKGKLPRP